MIIRPNFTRSLLMSSTKRMLDQVYLQLFLILIFRFSFSVAKVENSEKRQQKKKLNTVDRYSF